ncbi:MAG TPA: hypothetical protein VGI64_08730 [Streptosporangiaceae bacterium]|jgi:hypothetical protein
MTDIDDKSDIELHTANEHVIARVPLAGPVTDEWLRCYQRLARATGMPVQTQEHRHRAWIVVRVPASGNQREIEATMDAARGLIAAADAAQSRPATAQTENVVRDWWERKRESAARQPASSVKTMRAGTGVDKLWALLSALALVIAVPLLLPPRFSLGPNWVVPAIVAVLAAGIIVATRSPRGSRAAAVRPLCLALVVLLVAEAAGVTVRLVTDLIQGGPETNSASDLLSVGSGVWLFTILAFAALYWVLDGGGADGRLWDPPEFPNLAFPEQLNPNVAPPGWRPVFLDYLYLGFTNATAFSPTDVMPLARWAKAAMAVQATGSLVILGLVIARAVNILR